MSPTPPPVASHLPAIVPSDSPLRDQATGLFTKDSLPQLEAANAATDRWQDFVQGLATLSPGQVVLLLDEMRSSQTCARAHFGLAGPSLQQAAVRSLCDHIEQRLEQPDALYAEFLAAFTPATIEALGRPSDGLYRLLRTIPGGQQAEHVLWKAWFHMAAVALAQAETTRRRTPRPSPSEEATSLEVLWSHLHQHGPLGQSPVIINPSSAGVGAKSHDVSLACAAIAEWISVHPLESQYLEYIFAQIATMPATVQAPIQRLLPTAYKQAYDAWATNKNVDTGAAPRGDFWIHVDDGDTLLGKAARYLTTHKNQLPAVWFCLKHRISYVDKRAVIALREWLSTPGNTLRTTANWAKMVTENPEECQRLRERMRDIWDVPAQEGTQSAD